jgi:hypothetical protein
MGRFPKGTRSMGAAGMALAALVADGISRRTCVSS